MPQAPTTVLAEINGLYIALYDRAADNGGINYWLGVLQALDPSAGYSLTSPISNADATSLGQLFVSTQSTYFTATYEGAPNNPTNNPTVFVEALYQNIGGNQGDPSGIVYWTNKLAAAEAAYGPTPTALQIQTAESGIVGLFVSQMISYDLTGGQAASGLSATDYANAVLRQQQLLNKIAVSEFYATESALPGGSILVVTSTPIPATGAFAAAIDAVASVTSNPATVLAAEAAILAAVSSASLTPILNLPIALFGTETLTVNQDTFAVTGDWIFNAPLVQGPLLVLQPTLTSNDSLVDSGPGSALSVLNAVFEGNWAATGLNIQGIPTWNISNTEFVSGAVVGIPFSIFNWGTVYLSADYNIGGVISGLTTLFYDANSGGASLIIGDNAEPVQEVAGAFNSGGSFSVTVANAVGNGDNGVDVDFAASVFTGTTAHPDTINVTANIVGGFYETNGSYEVPAPILIAPLNGDNYNPNWLGYLDSAFAISAGASSGGPGGAAIGFQVWNVASTGAKAVGSMNIIALGGEGSTSATTLNLTDDGSNTMLFATFLSDSLLTDWSNLTTINLSGTSGFVTITGAEVTAAQINAFGVMGPAADDDGGGLLAANNAIVSIVGGLGNSFYDLSSESLATMSKAAIDGGHSILGNSEVAFNNLVVANAVAGSGAPPPGTTITLTHIQILDDVGGPIGTSGAVGQGGIINMADFAGLGTLNVPYALLAEQEPSYVVPPPGLPYTSVLTTDANGIVPVGYQLLQLLSADGSTGYGNNSNTLLSNLTIFDDVTLFAVNMQDMADGSKVVSSDGSTWTGITGNNITLWDESVAPAVLTNDHLKLWVSDDGIFNAGTTGSASAGITVHQGTYFDAPVFTVDNYTMVDIYLPFESASDTVVTGSGTSVTTFQQNYVILGSTAFIDQPVVTVPNATLNFYDNGTAKPVAGDNGGSPPGGPDNLVLGHTNFTANLYTDGLQALIPTLSPVFDIGITTVFLDSTTNSTTINDFGTGSLEIGATNTANLNAQSTTHLIMDLPGVPSYIFTSPFTGPATGITVNGSLTGQNLLQGTSLGVLIDANGTHNTSTNVSGVYEIVSAGGLGAGGVGNDVLTGGFDSLSVSTSHPTGTGVGTLVANIVGNYGDNFLPEGGNDIVNINHPTTITTLTPYDTVWVALYDVCNNGGANFGLGTGAVSGATDWGMGSIYGQAITDINTSGAEVYVDGYGPGVGTSINALVGPTGSATSSLTVNGFVLGNTSATGDILAFHAGDWATGALSTGADFGLVNESGVTINPAAVTASTMFSVGFAGEWTTTGVSTGTSTGTMSTATVTVDAIVGGTYQNAAQLVKGLTTATVGDIIFDQAAATIAAGSIEHMLIAYGVPGGGVNIADVELHNATGGAISGVAGSGANVGYGYDTATSGLTVTAVDLVDLTGVNLGNLNPHNIQFV